MRGDDYSANIYGAKIFDEFETEPLAYTNVLNLYLPKYQIQAMSCQSNPPMSILMYLRSLKRDQVN